MKLIFPDYVNNKPDWRGNTCEREADENNHYKCIDDIKNYIDLCFEPREAKKTSNIVILSNKQKLQIINELEEDIKKSITNNKLCRFVTNEFEDRKKNIEYILIQYPIDIKDKWKEQTNKLVEIERNNMRKSNTFVKQNKEEIFKLFLDIKDEIKILLKEKKKESNKKYYESVRDLLDIKPREILTEEQKKQNRELSIKKYYEKFREIHDIKPREILTEEQKEENRKLSQKKYKEKQLELIGKQPRVKLTEEEKKEKKKLANEKYREKSKLKNEGIVL
jgi:hypothetical protein